ncbi:MAG: response regulator [Ignavibacteriaceae bacterium]
MKVASKQKLLVIEDDQAILTGLEDYLKAENYDIVSSQDGLDGLNIALSEQPDLILLDVNLPSMNGFEVCRKLREEKFINPIIIITASVEEIDEVVGLEIGADDYIKKPFNLREVLARIRANTRKYERIILTSEEKQSRSDGIYRRHLMCVMFTDIKNYSQKMNEDEHQALILLQKHNILMKEIIAEYDGTIVEIIGDAFLVSFESAVKAVNCGIDIQNRFKSFNEDKSENEKIELRMGIHLGDLIEFEGKLKGDALNIAARIQQNAEANKVWISESVFLAVKGKTKLKYNKLGTQKFKNIHEPITIYSITE